MNITEDRIRAWVKAFDEMGAWRDGLKFPNKNQWVKIKDKFILVRLTQGLAMMIDIPDQESDEPFHEEELLKANCYCANTYGYAYNSKAGRFHRLLMERLGDVPDDMDVDHIDRCKLNNTRANLRVATRSMNSRNIGARADSQSGVKGIHWKKNNQSWVIQISINGKRTTRSVNPRKLDMTKDEALQEAIRVRDELYEEIGYDSE